MVKLHLRIESKTVFLVELDVHAILNVHATCDSCVWTVMCMCSLPSGHCQGFSAPLAFPLFQEWI